MLGVVLLVVVVLVVLLVAGGVVASGRRARASRAPLLERVRKADAELAAARAADQGWDPPVMEQAAREAFARTRPPSTVQEVLLVQVLDRPGVEDDEAVFRVTGSDGEAVDVPLRRAGGVWAG